MDASKFPERTKVNINFIVSINIPTGYLLQFKRFDSALTTSSTHQTIPHFKYQTHSSFEHAVFVKKKGKILLHILNPHIKSSSWSSVL